MPYRLDSTRRAMPKATNCHEQRASDEVLLVASGKPVGVSRASADVGCPGAIACIRGVGGNRPMLGDGHTG